MQTIRGLNSYGNFPQMTSSFSITLYVRVFIHILTASACDITYSFKQLQFRTFPMTKSPHRVAACFDTQHVTQCHSNEI